MKTFWIIIIILAAGAVIYFGYRWYQNRGIKRVSGGKAPTAEDIACASGNPTQKIIGSCTKPKYLTKAFGVKEKCFSSEKLGLDEGDQGPEIVTEYNGLGPKWFFNYQSGDNFCYVSKQIPIA